MNKKVIIAAGTGLVLGLGILAGCFGYDKGYHDCLIERAKDLKELKNFIEAAAEVAEVAEESV